LNIDLETRQRMWMQQDDAASHYAQRVPYGKESLARHYNPCDYCNPAQNYYTRRITCV